LWINTTAVQQKNALTVIKETRWSITSVLIVLVMALLKVLFNAVFTKEVDRIVSDDIVPI